MYVVFCSTTTTAY